jgi:hypothetical protein
LFGKVYMYDSKNAILCDVTKDFYCVKYWQLFSKRV